jgi:hypothetical protein
MAHPALLAAGAGLGLLLLLSKKSSAATGPGGMSVPPGSLPGTAPSPYSGGGSTSTTSSSILGGGSGGGSGGGGGGDNSTILGPSGTGGESGGILGPANVPSDSGDGSTADNSDDGTGNSLLSSSGEVVSGLAYPWNQYGMSPDPVARATSMSTGAPLGLRATGMHGGKHHHRRVGVAAYAAPTYANPPHLRTHPLPTGELGVWSARHKGWVPWYPGVELGHAPPAGLPVF